MHDFVQSSCLLTFMFIINIMHDFYNIRPDDLYHLTMRGKWKVKGVLLVSGALTLLGLYWARHKGADSTAHSEYVAQTSKSFPPEVHPDSRSRQLLQHRQSINRGRYFAKLSDSTTTQLCSDLYSWSESPVMEPVPVCGSKVRPVHSIKCYKSSITFPQHTKAMLGIKSNSSILDVMCTFEDLAVTPTRGQHYISKSLNINLNDELAPSLLTFEHSTQCPVPALAGLMLSTEAGDYTRTFVQEIINSNTVDPSRCQRWINDTTYFFVGSEPHNVYFIFLTYYNVYRTLAKDQDSKGNKFVIRFSGKPHRMFTNFEKKLFPDLITPDSLESYNSSDVLCFHKVIMVPRCYNSVPFQCVKQKDVQKVCLKCKNSKLEQLKKIQEMSSYMKFRTKVLNACDIKDGNLIKKKAMPFSHAKKMLFIRRKPFVRNSFDSPRMFQRVLSNEAELLSTLSNSFNSSQLTLKAVYMEDFDMCAQIRLASSVDIIMGVHGAGLVHLWWMRDDGWVMELVPKSQNRRPTYEALSAVLGRNYYNVSCLDQAIGSHFVAANISDVVWSVGRVLGLMTS